jgi:hypothetical protein
VQQHEVLFVDVLNGVDVTSRVPGGIRPYAPGHAQYDTWSEGIPRGKQGHTRMRCGHNVE